MKIDTRSRPNVLVRMALMRGGQPSRAIGVHSPSAAVRSLLEEEGEKR